MNIAEALLTYSNYPIPIGVISRILIERDLPAETEYSSTIAVDKAYRLSKADVFMFLYNAPDVKESEITISMKERQQFLKDAQSIYLEYADNSKTSSTIQSGYIGESFNI